MSTVSVRRTTNFVITNINTNSTTCSDTSPSITPNYNLNSNIKNFEYSAPFESRQSNSKEVEHKGIQKHSSAFIKEFEKNLGKVQD